MGEKAQKIVAMSASEVQQLKVEIEKKEKTLIDLSEKWDDDTALKRLPKHDQPAAVRAVVSAKKLANVLIPKLKFKADLSLRTPTDRRLQDGMTDEWKAIKSKIEWTLREFEQLETGKRTEYPTKEQKQRDMEMSKNIEQSLKSKRSALRSIGSTDDEASTSSSHFPEDGSGDMARNIKEGAGTRNLGTGDGSGPSLNTLNKDRKFLENVTNFKDRLSTGRLEHRETLSQIVEDVCPDDAASVKEYIRSLAASETIETDNVLTQDMLDEIRGFDAEEVDRRKAERNKKLAKSNEIREQRIQKIERLADVETVLTRPSIPSPLPIDGFLDLVETLPGEIQKLVTKETEALSDYYKNQVFMNKQPLSSRQGKLVNMNALKKEHKDDRFDVSDFHIRAKESDIAEEHLKRLKESRVDNAVGRFFGTFSSQSNFDVEESDILKSPEDEDMGLSFDQVE